MDKLTVNKIEEASKKLEGVINKTPLWFSKRLSQLYNAKVYLKREDLQEVRSYKIRGAYNFMSNLTPSQKTKGVVCASAGNHAQGVALSATLLKIKAVIFMPTVTPLQKINKARIFGGEWADVRLEGLTFDESFIAATKYCQKKNSVFVHPFNDYQVMAGQGTVGKEIYEQIESQIDFVFCPIGGGGLISGVSTYLKQKSPQTKIIGVQAEGASGMLQSLKAKKVVSLQTIDTFADGVAVKVVGDKTFPIVAKNVSKIALVPEGKICSTMIELYQNEGIISEPAGALSISALDNFAKDLIDKTVVCILSGGNNDILRYPEIMEKSLVYKGLKHYFLVEFAQKPGQLRKFVDSALGPTDDIVRFEYIKKTSKETGAALIGIELQNKEDIYSFKKRMESLEIKYTHITGSDILYSYLV